MKGLLRQILPEALRKKLGASLARRRNLHRLRDNFSYDQKRFLENASPFRQFESREHLLSYIVMLAHSLEKGLALRDVRVGFGSEKLSSLIDAIRSFLDDYGPDAMVASAISSIEAYIAFSEAQGKTLPEVIDSTRSLRVRMQCLDEQSSRYGGGVREISADIVRHASSIDLACFYEHRYSVRQFSARPVDMDDIRDSIRLAQKSPSVCNRQSARVYVLENDELGRKALACQQGNRGFGHEANKIIIVTSELGSFLSVGERNQCWIDGGMFAASLIYALHSKGLATCCLNWSVEHDADRRLRSVVPIATSENVIMLLAIGHYPERLCVAYSERKPVDEIARFLRQGSSPLSPRNPRQ